MGGGHPSCPARGKGEHYKLPLGDLGGGLEANAVCIEQTPKITHKAAAGRHFYN